MGQQALHSFPESVQNKETITKVVMAEESKAEKSNERVKRCSRSPGDWGREVKKEPCNEKQRNAPEHGGDDTHRHRPGKPMPIKVQRADEFIRDIAVFHLRLDFLVDIPGKELEQCLSNPDESGCLQEGNRLRG